MSGMLASMSRPELFIAAGAALLVITALLFTVVAGYGVSDLVLVAAVFALVAVLRHRQLPQVIASNYQALLFAVGALLVVVAGRNLLNDLVYIATPPAGITVPRLTGMLGFYIGVALVGFGAWQLWKGRKA
ncbi:MAG: hypothetical protein WD830_11440 [Chloroflexota bacterium]